MKDNIVVILIVLIVSCVAGAIITLARAVWLAPPIVTASPSIELDLGRITDATTNGFTLRTSFKPCEARVTNGQWTIHFKR